MTEKLQAIYRTPSITGGVSDDIEKVLEGDNHTQYVLNGGLLLRMGDYRKARGILFDSGVHNEG